MQSIEFLGTFDEILLTRPPDIVELARHLRRLIAEAHPDVVGVPRTREGAAAYGWGEKKMSESNAYIAPQASEVNLGVHHAASLADSDNLLEGTGPKIRHVKVRATGLDERPLRALLEEAKRERAQALGLEDAPTRGALTCGVPSSRESPATTTRPTLSRISLGLTV